MKTEYLYQRTDKSSLLMETLMILLRPLYVPMYTVVTISNAVVLHNKHLNTLFIFRFYDFLFFYKADMWKIIFRNLRAFLYYSLRFFFFFLKN